MRNREFAPGKAIKESLAAGFMVEAAVAANMLKSLKPVGDYCLRQFTAKTLKGIDKGITRFSKIIFAG